MYFCKNGHEMLDQKKKLTAYDALQYNGKDSLRFI